MPRPAAWVRPLLAFGLWVALVLGLPLAGAILGQVPLGEIFALPLKTRAWDALPVPSRVIGAPA